MYRHSDKVVSSVFSMLASTLVFGFLSPFLLEPSGEVSKAKLLLLLCSLIALGLILFYALLPIVRAVLFDWFDELGDYCGLYVEVYRLGPWAVIAPFSLSFDPRTEKLKVRGYAFRVNNVNEGQISAPKEHSWSSITVDLMKDAQSDLVTLNYLYVSDSQDAGADQLPGVTRTILKRNACSSGSFTHLGGHGKSYQEHFAFTWRGSERGLKLLNALAVDKVVSPTVHFRCFKVSSSRASSLAASAWLSFRSQRLQNFSRQTTEMSDLAKRLAADTHGERRNCFPSFHQDFADEWERIRSGLHAETIKRERSRGVAG